MLLPLLCQMLLHSNSCCNASTTASPDTVACCMAIAATTRLYHQSCIIVLQRQPVSVSRHHWLIVISNMKFHDAIAAMLHGNRYRNAAAVDPASVHVMPLLVDCLLLSLINCWHIRIFWYDGAAIALHLCTGATCLPSPPVDCCHSYYFKFFLMLSISHCWQDAVITILVLDSHRAVIILAVAVSNINLFDTITCCKGLPLPAVTTINCLMWSLTGKPHHWLPVPDAIACCMATAAAMPHNSCCNATATGCDAVATDPLSPFFCLSLSPVNPVYV